MASNTPSRRFRVACAHELDWAYGPSWFARWICRHFGHNWTDACEPHGIRECVRCHITGGFCV